MTRQGPLGVTMETRTVKSSKPAEKFIMKRNLAEIGSMQYIIYYKLVCEHKCMCTCVCARACVSKSINGWCANSQVCACCMLFSTVIEVVRKISLA